MYAQKVYGQLSLFGAEKSVDKNEYSQKMNNYSSELAKQTEQTSKVISFADYFLPFCLAYTGGNLCYVA